MSKRPKPSAEVIEFANELAVLLGETERVPIKQITRVVQIIGIDFSRQIYKETAEIEDKGGMMLTDNSRRRTRGGVFFHLVRTKVDPELRQVIFPTFKSSKAAAKKQKAPPGVPLLTWDERIGIIQALQSQQGEIKSVKVILTGRPGSVEKRPEVVVTTMSDTATAPNLPRGIPTPPTEAILYTVYMSPKQWEKLEASLEDPADVLLIEGTCIFDAAAGTMAVVANTARSELVEAKIREQQKEVAAKEKAAKAATPPKPPKPATDGAALASKPAASPAQSQAKSGKKSRIADMQPEVVAAPAAPLNPNLPPDVARKLNELYASASLFRQKVTNLQGKPAGQQFGLEMTQKLLKNVEDEIATIEKKYNN